MLLSGAMMLDHLGEHQAAALITNAVKAVKASDRFRTPDVGGTATTAEFCAAVARELDGMAREER